MRPEAALAIPLMALLIPIVIVPVILGIRYERQKRELEHAERMKALELGRTLPGDEPWLSPPKLCLAIGGVVPIGVFLVAMLACQSLGYRDEIFVFAGLVGVTAVVCGTILTLKWFEQRATTAAGRLDRAGQAKPAFDADAYDL